MNSNIKTGRIVGMLLLLIMVIGIASTSLNNMGRSLMESSTFLQDVYAEAFQMKWVVLLDIAASTVGLSISILVYPLLKHYHRSIALWYFGFWILQFSTTIFGNISHLSLMSLSQVFVESGFNFEGQPYFQALGKLKVEEYFSSHFLSLIAYSMGAMVFYFGLFKTRLIPRILAGWGVLAVVIVFSATWLQIFDQDVDFAVYLQNGVHMLCLIVWLLIKGFKTDHQSTVVA